MPGGNAADIINTACANFGLPQIGEWVGVAATTINDGFGWFEGEPHSYCVHTLAVEYVYGDRQKIYALYTFASSDSASCEHFSGINVNARVYYCGWVPGESYSFLLY